MSHYANMLKRVGENGNNLEEKRTRQSKERAARIAAKENELITLFVKEWELFLDEVVNSLGEIINLAADKLVEICLQDILDFKRDSYAYDLLSEWIAPEENPFLIFEEQTKNSHALKEQAKLLSPSAQNDFLIRRSLILCKNIQDPVSHADFILDSFRDVFFHHLDLAIADPAILFSSSGFDNAYAKIMNIYGHYCIYVTFYKK